MLKFDPGAESVLTAHHRLRAAYALERGAPVPVVEPGGYARVYSTQEMLADLDKMVEHAAAWANALAATGSDWPPMLDTFVGVCMVAEAFGCPVVHTPGADPWARPAVGSIGEVWKLKPPRVGESFMVRRLFEFTDRLQRRLGTEVPIWTMDIQSPFSVAAHVVEPTELLTACITAPEAVHHLCRMITDFSIEMTRQHLARMERPGFPGRNFPSIPDDIGICIADDTPLIMLSPDMYAEFALPYNSQIGEAFGGVHVHSCGEYGHNLDNVLRITNVRSIQVHAGVGEFKLPATAAENHPFNRARGRVSILVDANPISRGDAYARRPRDHYTDYVLPRLAGAPLTGIILQSCGPGQGLADLKAALEWTRAATRQPA
ncbi:MAG: methylcobalamin:coenzyme M methyltransferase [Lentisphaerae bacterium ADurb.BinA184]|nr:MAG: methylcobalamin:coenzyme M methyltransferase [Lentisphaerae bacterium ADurb.BinA184]